MKHSQRCVPPAGGLLGAATIVLAGLTACGGGSSVECTDEPPLTVPVIDVERVLDWEPLGFVNGLGHVFPTDHQYLRVVDPDIQGQPQATVYAPSDLVLREVGSSERDGHTEYEATMEVCGGLLLGFGHLQSFDQELLARLGEPDHCETYDPGAGPITKCFRRGEVAVAAGTVLGTVGHPTSPFLDVSALDERRSNTFITTREQIYPRLHAVSALDLFVPELRDAYASVVGRYGERRTALPLGGTLEIDVADTAQGYWYRPGEPTSTESVHFALVPDYIHPDGRAIASLGESLALGGGEVRFAIAAGGTRNRRPSDVTANGQAYCFDDNLGALLVAMPTSTTLRAQYFASASCELALVFGAEAVVFER